MRRTYDVDVLVANKHGVHTVRVSLDARDALSAQDDATAMLHYGDGWHVLKVVSVTPAGP